MATPWVDGAITDRGTCDGRYLRQPASLWEDIPPGLKMFSPARTSQLPLVTALTTQMLASS
jgi:hypothetical protein